MSSSQEDYKMSEEGEVQSLRPRHGGMLLPMVITTALELGFFDFMAKTPSAHFSCFDLASSLPKQTQQTPALVERILRFLASHSILTLTVVKDGDGEPKMLYGMTEVSHAYVRKQDGFSLVESHLLIYDKVFIDAWYHQKDALLEGETPFNKAHGMGIFEYIEKDKRFSKLLNKCMYDSTGKVMNMILEKYKGFEGTKELVDVGGGSGANIELIIRKYPYIKGINFDLTHVIMNAPLIPGVEHVGGDMFQSVPKGDVIFIKVILHNWGDNYCIKLLRNCWEALPKNGKVVVAELLMPDPESDDICDEVSKSVISSDMLMMIAHQDGKERTLKDFNILAKVAGFNSVKIITKISAICIMEFYKKSLLELT